VQLATGDPIGRFRTPVGVIATSNPVGVITASRIPVSIGIANSSAPPTAPSSNLITLNGMLVPPPSDTPSSSGSASLSTQPPRWSGSDPPTAHPLWKGPSAAQPHSNAPFDDFSDKDLRDQALEAILSLISCSTALAVRVLSVPRLMDILLRVIMVGSISSYGGSVVAPNSSAAYPQSDTISAASRVLQVWTRYRLVFNYRLIESPIRCCRS